MTRINDILLTIVLLLMLGGLLAVFADAITWNRIGEKIKEDKSNKDQQQDLLLYQLQNQQSWHNKLNNFYFRQLYHNHAHESTTSD